MVYRWAGDNVWVTQVVFDLMWDALLECPLRMATMDTRTRYVVWESFKPAANAIATSFFDGGLLGAEMFNYYATHTCPETEKKVRIGLSEY